MARVEAVQRRKMTLAKRPTVPIQNGAIAYVVASSDRQEDDWNERQCVQQHNANSDELAEV